MLTRLQGLFVEYYLGEANGNGVKAARMAGYRGSYSVLGVTAHDLLRLPKIQDAIADKDSGVFMSTKEILSRLSALGRADVSDFVSIDGSQDYPIPSLDIKKAKRRGQLITVKKIKTMRSGGDDPQEITEVEIRDPLAALTLLAKLRGIIDQPLPDESRKAASLDFTTPDEDFDVR